MLTTHYVPGTPNWLDLGAPDIDAAVSFYTAVFGWSFQSAGPDAGGYGFFQLDGRTVGAVGPLVKGADSSWTVYFHTEDADRTTRTVQQAGGKVRVPAMDVFTAGRLAGFSDPTGAEFAVWQPGDVQGLDAVMESNTLCWTELHTSDAAAAKAFYRSVFSWDYQDMSMGGDDMVYTVVSSPGGGKGEDSGQGGVMELPKENRDAGTASEWHPYFGVTDCDATFASATGRGASVLMAPSSVPGVGRLAMLRDPAGAQFALIKGDPTTT